MFVEKIDPYGARGAVRRAEAEAAAEESTLGKGFHVEVGRGLGSSRPVPYVTKGDVACFGRAIRSAVSVGISAMRLGLQTVALNSRHLTDFVLAPINIRTGTIPLYWVKILK